MKYNIVPVGRNILVKPTGVKKTESGIILMDTTLDAEQRATTTGTVLAVAPLAWNDLEDPTPWAKVGDVVIFKAHTGMRVKNKEEDEDFLLIMRDVDIAGIQKGES